MDDLELKVSNYRTTFYIFQKSSPLFTILYGVCLYEASLSVKYDGSHSLAEYLNIIETSTCLYIVN